MLYMYSFFNVMCKIKNMSTLYDVLIKEESEKVGLKLNIQKTKNMASSLITSWQIDGETVETVRLFLRAPKSLQMVTAAMKLRLLLLGRIVMTNLHSILKGETLLCQQRSV